MKGIRVPGGAADYGRNQLDGLTDRAKQLGAKGLVWMKVGDGGTLDSPVAKFLSRQSSRRWSTRSTPNRATSCCSSPTSG